jgi:hypothetical protein
MELLQSADFWIGLLKIIWINIILSGDNAVVIALAARTLPAHQQRKAVFWGSGAAVVLRILLTVVAAKLLALPYLQIVGGLLLLWIGVQLLGDEDEGEGEAKEHGTLMAAVRTILIADLVMSLDNPGPGDQHPAGDLRQHPDDQADGALPRHRHTRRRADRLGRRRNHRQRLHLQGFRGCEPLDALRCSRSRRRACDRARQADAGPRTQRESGLTHIRRPSSAASVHICNKT